MLDAVKALSKPYDEADRAAAEAKARRDPGEGRGLRQARCRGPGEEARGDGEAEPARRMERRGRQGPGADAILELQRKAQWRLDFVAAENSMGFHAPQELARLLGESIDYSRQADARAAQWRPTTR